VRYQNVYGIDMPVAGELVAHNRTEDGVAEAIGADRLFYQSIEDLIAAVRRGNPGIDQFDLSCFTGDYVTGGVTTDYLERIAEERNDDAKERRKAVSEA
jgi:amidophosphoribosyltransferase